MEEGCAKIALVGAGRWGTSVARDLSTDGKLAAIVSRTVSEPAVQDLATQLSVPVITLEALCSRTDITAAWVATPIATHAEIGKKLLAANKHVMVEKPTAGNTEEARSLTEEAKSSNKIFATGYVFLYHPVFQELKKKIDISRVVNMLCVWQKFGTFVEPIELNLFTHHLSLALNLFGKPNGGKMEISKNGNVLNADLSYDALSFSSRIDRENENRNHSIKITMDDNSSYLWEDSKLSFRSNPEEQYSTIFESTTTALASEISAFADAVAKGDSSLLPSSGDFGVRVLETLDKLTPTSRSSEHT